MNANLAAVATQPDGADAAVDSTISLGELSNYIGFYLRITQALSFQAFVRQAGDTDIRAGYFAVLTLIGENPGITQTALSRANGRDKSSLTPVLDELVRRGLVSRERIESNRRAYALRLTPLGKKARRKLLQAANQHEKNLRQALGKEDAAELFRMLKVLAAALGKRLSAETPARE
jgi:DNA-binding MarR family transcriptional regulator